MEDICLLRNNVMRKVMDYFAQEDASQISHTQSVANYTYLIAVGEKRDNREVSLLEIAAWMHDIGCPAARAKYGNSAPVNQQKEGRRITEEWFRDCNDLTLAEKQWLSDVVGTHHQFAHAQELHAEPLFEADLIVNLFEGYYKMEQAQHYFDTMMTTETGRGLYKKFFLEKINH